PLDGALLRAAARRLRRPARAARGPRRRAPHPRVLPARPEAPRARRGARRPGDRLMAIKPEDALRAIAAARGDALCVPTMTTAPAWRTIAPNDLSVGCVGFMGGASSLGLGLALARPDRRVLVFDGDGSLLMQLGSLATVAGAAPRNLVHLLFKNGVYHPSRAQEIPGGGGADFVRMAQGAGCRAAAATGARRARGRGPAEVAAPARVHLAERLAGGERGAEIDPVRRQAPGQAAAHQPRPRRQHQRRLHLARMPLALRRRTLQQPGDPRVRHRALRPRRGRESREQHPNPAPASRAPPRGSSPPLRGSRARRPASGHGGSASGTIGPPACYTASRGAAVTLRRRGEDGGRRLWRRDAARAGSPRARS